MAKYNYKGKPYPSLKAIYDECGDPEIVSFSRFKSRMSDDGMEMEEALTTPAKRPNKYILDGIEYENARSAYDDNIDKAQVKYGSFQARLMKGWDTKKALTKPPTRPKGDIKETFKVNGKTYKSLSKLAIDANITHKLAIGRYKAGYSDKEIFYGKAGVIEVNGVEYKTISIAYNTLKPNKPLSRVRTLIKQCKRDNQPCDRAFLDEQGYSQPPISCNGVTYKSIFELAEAYSQPASTLEDRIYREKLSPEEAVVPRIKTGMYNKKTLTRNKKLSSSRASLYFVKIYMKDGDYYKIGITKNSAKERLCRVKHKILKEYKTTLEKAYELEQKVLKEYEENLYPVNDANFAGRTETFILTSKEEKDVLSFLNLNTKIK